MKSNGPTVNSPVMVSLLQGERGDGNWPGFDYVYTRIAQACERMGASPSLHLSDEHVDAMAALGSGHEERMKGMLMHLRYRGFVESSGAKQ